MEEILADTTTLQARLPGAWAANHAGSTVPHVSVIVPSFGLGESVLSHYASRIPALEHRFLGAAFQLGRTPGCEAIFLTCRHPTDTVLNYYAHTGMPEDPVAFRRRLHVVVVPDDSVRSICAKAIEHPETIEEVRRIINGRPAIIEPWNVTEAEVEFARLVGEPLNGTAPDLWPMGFKSAGRRLFEQAGVPVPLGCEDIHDVAEVTAAIELIRSRHPDVAGVVVKHDNSGAGDGNTVVALRDSTGFPRSAEDLARSLTELPQWYLQDLAAGGVVEELVSGTDFASPSVQLDITPYGDVVVLATHEQVLGGENAQVYLGCAFPARRAYAVELAKHGRAVGAELARAGAVGRFGVDFVAVREDEDWGLFALEINLRKGGTTHPFSALRHLVPGVYEPARGWIAHDGRARFYRSTDNLLDPEWLGRDPAAVIAAVHDAGIAFDHQTGTGVVLHMLSCLAIDGRCGYTAIGLSRSHADDLAEETRDAIASAR